MKISVPDILAESPKKLLRYYPEMMERLWARKQAKQAGIKDEVLPPLPVYIYTGSRYGGKTQFVYRSAISGIFDGYVDSVMLCTITEDGSKDSVKLIDEILEFAEEPVPKIREVDHPIRVLSNGETIYLEYLNKKDTKARQQTADIMIIEELEAWNARDGYKSLLTMLRHFDLVIIISNKLPVWANKLLGAFNPTTVRIDYQENEAFKRRNRTIYEGLEKLKLSDPEEWNNFIMYNDVGGSNRVYSERHIEQLFKPLNTDFTPKISILSVDVGGGGADNSCVFLLEMDISGAVQGRMLMDESVAPHILIDRMQQYRAEARAIEEVWDVQGVGLGIAQMRFHKTDWVRQGLIPFFGKAVDEKNYYNARSESIILTKDLLQNGGLVISGLNGNQIEELTEEMRATTYDNKEASKMQKNLETKITKKEEIKKELGRSPNKLDALTMGVWRLMTHYKNRSLTTNINSGYKLVMKGVPTLDE